MHHAEHRPTSFALVTITLLLCPVGPLSPTLVPSASLHAAPGQDSPVEVSGGPATADLTFALNGERYMLSEGDVYLLRDGAAPLFILNFYDPDFFANNYRWHNGSPHQLDPDSGQLYPVVTDFQDSFEGASSVNELLTVSRWHLDSAARNGQSGNRVALSDGVVRHGSQSLRCHAVPSSQAASKASLARSLMFFRKGDVVRFSGWFFLEHTPSIYDRGGFTLFDLESSFMRYVGMRVIFTSNDALAFELEFPKVTFRQDRDQSVPFPTGRWVHVEARMVLSDDAGHVQLWQDGDLVLDRIGRTLPVEEVVYDRFEVGISAIAKGSRYDKVLFVDDVRLWRTAN